MITDEQVNVACNRINERHSYTVASKKAMREVLETFEQSKWVSVKDNLPESGIYVLWRCTELDMAEKREHFRITACFNNRPPKMDAVKFTHWQPLPEFKE